MGWKHRTEINAFAFQKCLASVPQETLCGFVAVGKTVKQRMRVDSDALPLHEGAQMVSVTPLDEGKLLSVAERSNSSLTKQPAMY